MFSAPLLALAATLAAFSPSHSSRSFAPTSQDASEENDGNKLVQVALLCDRDAIHAGETFQLGVQLRVTPRWHIYWQNAGEAGKATEAHLRGPDGFEIGEIRFPCPTRHMSEGDIVSYVHEGEVLLVASVKAPANLAAGSKVRFTVDADWLVCIESCFIGSGKSTLELGVVAPEAKTNPANVKVFEGGLAKLPREWDAVLGEKNKPEFEEGQEGTFTVTIEVPGAQELEFFPLDDTHSRFVKGVASKIDGGRRLVLHYEHDGSSKKYDYPGVLHIRSATGETSCIERFGVAIVH